MGMGEGMWIYIYLCEIISSFGQCLTLSLLLFWNVLSSFSLSSVLISFPLYLVHVGGLSGVILHFFL